MLMQQCASAPKNNHKWSEFHIKRRKAKETCGCTTTIDWRTD